MLFKLWMVSINGPLNSQNTIKVTIMMLFEVDVHDFSHICSFLHLLFRCRVSDSQTLKQLLTPYIHPTESDPVTRQKWALFHLISFFSLFAGVAATGRSALLSSNENCVWVLQ